jgi:hypothetical protein
MALNKIYASTEAKHRLRTVGTNVQPGTPLLVNARPAVTITASGDATKTQTTNLPSGLTSITYENGGFGNPDNQAVVAYDGTWEFAVTGATTSTASDVAVYITSGGALTTTASGNTLFGYTDYPPDYRKTAGRAPVRIGA